MKSPTLNELAIRLSATCLLVLTVYIVWSLSIDGTLTNKPVVYWPGCFGVTKHHFHPGEDITARVVATKYSTLKGDVNWNLMNLDTKRVYPYAPRKTVLDQGFADYTMSLATLASDVPSGRYKMLGMVTFSVNPLKDITYALSTDEFEVQNGTNE